MADLLSYTGNAGLGFGSNPQLEAPVSPNTFDVLNQASRDFANWANQQNALLFRQKVSDRDNLLNMVATDQVALGKVLPDYLPEIEKAKAEQEKAFEEFGGDFNNTKAFLKYKQAFQKAKDLATIAQVNTAMIGDIRQAEANEPIAFRKKQVRDFEKAQIAKGLSDFVTPYGKNLYPNFDALAADIAGGAMSATADAKGQKAKPSLNVSRETAPQQTSGAGLSPFVKQADKFVNYDDYLGRATLGYLDPTGERKEQQDLLRNAIENADPVNAKRFIESVNERIDLYNEQTKGIATPAKRLESGVDFTEVVDPATGQSRIKFTMNTPELAAKFALAQTPGNYFQEGGVAFDKNIGDYLAKQQELQIKMKDLGIKGLRARAYADYMGQKVKQLKQDGVDENNVKLISDRWQANPILSSVSAPAWTFDAMSGKKGTSGLIFDVTDIPTNFRDVLIVTDPISKKQVNRAPDFFVEPTTGKKYLKGEILTQDGTKLDLSREGIEKELNKQKKAGNVRASVTVDDAINVMNRKIKEGLDAGVYKSLMRDRAGNVIDVSSISDAYRRINNAIASKKGQEPLFVEREEVIEE